MIRGKSSEMSLCNVLCGVSEQGFSIAGRLGMNEREHDRLRVGRIDIFIMLPVWSTTSRN